MFPQWVRVSIFCSSLLVAFAIGHFVGSHTVWRGQDANELLEVGFRIITPEGDEVQRFVDDERTPQEIRKYLKSRGH